MGKGLLFASFDFSGAHEDEFHDWYDLEHIPERQRVPGFLACERWIGEENPKIAVATYDLQALSILRSPAYLAIGGDNLSVWSKRVTAMCQRIMRYEGEQLLPGDAVAPAGAGALLVASMNVDPSAEHEFNESVQYRASAAACRGAGRAVRAALQRNGRAKVSRDVPPDRSGRCAIGRMAQGGRHALDPAHAAAVPRHAAASVQAIRSREVTGARLTVWQTRTAVVTFSAKQRWCAHGYAHRRPRDDRARRRWDPSRCAVLP